MRMQTQPGDLHAKIKECLVVSGGKPLADQGEQWQIEREGSVSTEVVALEVDF